MTKRTLHIAAYDVSDAGRLRDALKLLKTYASGRQKSVFECFLTHVALDGPALCVAHEEQAPRLFPLCRLSRIYCSDRVAWATNALLGCACAGVVVVFIDEEGEVVARLLGHPGERDELYHRLTEFLLLPQAGGMYVHWREDLRRRAAWWAGLKLRVPAANRRPVRCPEAINMQAVRYAGKKAGERSLQWLRSTTEPIFPMAMHKPQTYLLAYDIADPQRLVRVHRTCKQWGVPIQYSVFIVPLTPAGIGGLVMELRDIIDERVDDIRVYPLPARVEVSQYGRQGLPDGIEIVGGRLGGEKIVALAVRRNAGRKKRVRPEH